MNNSDDETFSDAISAVPMSTQTVTDSYQRAFPVPEIVYSLYDPYNANSASAYYNQSYERKYRDGVKKSEQSKATEIESEQAQYIIQKIPTQKAIAAVPMSTQTVTDSYQRALPVPEIVYSLHDPYNANSASAYYNQSYERKYRNRIKKSEQSKATEIESEQAQYNLVQKIPTQDNKVEQIQENETDGGKPDFENDGFLNELSKDLSAMLEKSQFSDINIKCGQETFKAHKNILCSRSPVFDALFNGSMQETDNDTIVIDDVDPVIFRILLIFLYSGQIQDLNVSTAGDLLYATEKYQLYALKKNIVQCLISNLSSDNALDLLKRGHLYDKHLKASALAYISKNFANFKSTESWNNFEVENVDLAMEILKNVIENCYKLNSY